MDTTFKPNINSGSNGTSAGYVRLVWMITNPNTRTWVVDPKKFIFGTFEKAKLFHSQAGANKVRCRMEQEFNTTLVVVNCSIRID